MTEKTPGGRGHADHHVPRPTYTNQDGELLAENEETIIFVALER